MTLRMSLLCVLWSSANCTSCSSLSCFQFMRSSSHHCHWRRPHLFLPTIGPELCLFHDMCEVTCDRSTSVYVVDSAKQSSFLVNTFEHFFVCYVICVWNFHWFPVPRHSKCLFMFTARSSATYVTTGHARACASQAFSMFDFSTVNPFGP